ncbi:hypothetical protein Trydic_g10592, partial [Trypoxylus dichotomus]
MNAFICVALLVVTAFASPVKDEAVVDVVQDTEGY